MLIKADMSQLDALAVQFVKAGGDVRRPVGLELREAAKQVRREGRENVRKLSGRTARSITYSSRKKGLQYVIGPKWFVGRFLEFGTVNMPAYPFMAPAAARQSGLPGRVADAAAKAMFVGTFAPQSLV